MRKIVLLFVLISINYLFYAQSIKLGWEDTLSGDFSFANKWSYSDNIFRNQFGQLVCDNICPEELERMKDTKGRILKDSLSAYYKLVDTTHYFHAIETNFEMFKFGEAQKIKNDTVVFRTGNEFSINYYTLVIKIVNSQCIAYIKSVSPIRPSSLDVFRATSGYIKIDEKQFERGVLKAEFEFNFNYVERGYQNTKGKILVPLTD
jgi:hypothetical protein